MRTTGPSSPDSKRGISLVELMVAVTVLTLAILGTLTTQASCRKLSKTGRETTRAVADLQSAMEEILLLPIEDIPHEDGDYAPGLPIARFTDLHLNGETITPTYPGLGGGVVPDPLEIILTCQWIDHGGRARTLTFANLKTR